MIYLDNSATTQAHPQVVEAMIPYLNEKWGNPSSIHGAGQQAHSAVQAARQQVACLLNCEPGQVYFAPSGTYANNVAILGRARFAEANNQGRHLITSAIEHPSIVGPMQYLESAGWKVTWLPVNREGFVNPAALINAITSQTSVISIMWANNEIGTVEPIQELAEIAADRRIYFHTDAIQVAGKLPIDLSKLPASTLSISGHKFHAPKGIGALFVRKGVNVMPLVFGGGQEQGLFPGTEGLADIVGMGKAAEICTEEFDRALDGAIPGTTYGVTQKLRELQQVFKEKLKGVPGIRFTGPEDIEHRLPGHVSLVVSGIQGEALVMRAALQDICISSGSACHRGMIEPSHVMRAIGLPDAEAGGSIRISCSRSNTLQECTEAAARLADILSMPATTSPVAVS